MKKIIIKKVKTKEYQLIIEPPLVVYPKYVNDCKQIVIVEYEDLKINLYSFSRKGLIKQLKDECIILWEHYALPDPKELTIDAQELQEKIKLRFKVK